MKQVTCIRNAAKKQGPNSSRLNNNGNNFRAYIITVLKKVRLSFVVSDLIDLVAAQQGCKMFFY